jgi:hypothetical protein
MTPRTKESTEMEAALLLLCTFFGAFILYVLTRTGGRQPFSLFYAININTDRSAHPMTVLLDMTCSSALGGIAVYFLTSPSNYAQAIVVGLGMTGILSAHAKDTSSAG